MGWITQHKGWTSSAYGKGKWKQLQKRSKLVELSLPICQLYQWNPLFLVIDNPHIMTIDPSILRQYGLGLDVSEADPQLHCLLMIAPYLWCHPSNLTMTKQRSTVLNVKDLKTDHRY
jgi:hypothetical protein